MSDLVDGQRQEDYGDPVENMGLVAAMWSGFISTSRGRSIILDGQDAAIMMALFKIARLTNKPKHKDSMDDFDGYIKIAKRCREASK